MHIKSIVFVYARVCVCVASKVYFSYSRQLCSGVWHHCGSDPNATHTHTRGRSNKIIKTDCSFLLSQFLSKLSGELSMASRRKTFKVIISSTVVRTEQKQEGTTAVLVVNKVFPDFLSTHLSFFVGFYCIFQNRTIDCVSIHSLRVWTEQFEVADVITAPSLSQLTKDGSNRNATLKYKLVLADFQFASLLDFASLCIPQCFACSWCFFFFTQNFTDRRGGGGGGLIQLWFWFNLYVQISENTCKQ